MHSETQPAGFLRDKLLARTTMSMPTLPDHQRRQRLYASSHSPYRLLHLLVYLLLSMSLLSLTTAQVTLTNPAGGQTYGQSTPLSLTYTLSEAAVAGSLKYIVDPIFPGDTRTITIDDGADDGAGSTYGAIGTHTIAIQSTFSTIVADNVAVTAIAPSPTTDLAHKSNSGMLVLTKVQYQNAGGATRNSNNAIFFWDGLTEVPTVTSPTASGSIQVGFSLVFQLKESAKAGTVKLTMTPTNADSRSTATDPAAPRVIVFSSTSSGSILFTSLSTAAANVAEISSVTPATDLVTGASYDLLFEYEDLYDNPKATLTLVNVLHDTVTLDLVAVAPTASARIPIQFTGTFTLPEVAFQAVLVINPLDAKDPACPSDNTAAGACLGDALPSRIVTFGNTFKNAGTHSFTVPAGGLTDLAASESNILDVECDGQPGCALNLVHGNLYFFTYKYKDSLQNVDGNGNEFSEDGIIVTFDSQTFAPVLVLPENNTRVLDGFALKYELLEAAATTTVKITLTVMSWSGVADPQSPHVLVVKPTRETAAIHEIPITNLANILDGTNHDVLSVSPTGQDLVNGATYNLDMEYQDVAGNTAASLTGNYFVVFDSATLAPTLTSPSASSSIGASFTVAFVIPEEMKDGTCKISITETGGGVDDPVPNPRVMTLGTAEHSAGTYSYTLTSSHLTQTPFPQSWVSSVSSKFDLSDGE